MPRPVLSEVKAQPNVKPGQRIVLYGGPKVGKSSVLHCCPSIHIVDADGAIPRMAKVPGHDTPSHTTLGPGHDWRDFLKMIDPSSYGDGNINPAVLAIDSASPVVELAKADVCKHEVNKKGERVSSIEEFGYGSGWTFVYDRLNLILAYLDEHVSVGRHVVLVCHSHQENIKTHDSSEDAFVRAVPALPQVGKTCRFVDRVYGWADHVVYASRKYNIEDGRATLMRRQLCFVEDRGDFMAGSRSISHEPIDHTLGKTEQFWKLVTAGGIDV